MSSCFATEHPVSEDHKTHVRLLCHTCFFGSVPQFLHLHGTVLHSSCGSTDDSSRRGRFPRSREAQRGNQVAVGAVATSPEEEPELEPVREDVTYHTNRAPESGSGNMLPHKVFVVNRMSVAVSPSGEYPAQAVHFATAPWLWSVFHAFPSSSLHRDFLHALPHIYTFAKEKRSTSVVFAATQDSRVAVCQTFPAQHRFEFWRS